MPEPLDDRAHLAVFGLCWYMLTAVALSALGIMQVGKLEDAIAEQERPQQIGDLDITVQVRLLEERDDLAELGLVLWLLGALVAGITFVRWFHRAYRNLDVLAPEARRFHEGWAVLGWIVPVVWFWRPKQVADDLARGLGREQDVPGLLAWWWVLWIATALFSPATGAFLGSGEPEAVRTLDIIHAATSALSIVAAVMAIRVVRRLTVAHAYAALAHREALTLDFKLS